MDTAALKLLAEHGGLVGLLIGVLVLLQGSLNVLFVKMIADRDRRIAHIQDQRVADAKESIQQVEDMTRTLGELMTTMHTLKDAVLWAVRGSG